MTRLEELRKQRAEIDAEIEKMGKDITATDPIYLMSAEEYEQYEDRIPYWNDWWWLRSPGCNPCCAAVVHYDGLVGHNGININYSTYVRPVLNKNNLTVADCLGIVPVEDDDNKMIFCGITWVELDYNFWIAETPIATRRFDVESNNYAKSEIRQFLLDWYNERRKW